eukprot:7013386-Pyramimonas_sp.AAC.1
MTVHAVTGPGGLLYLQDAATRADAPLVPPVVAAVPWEGIGLQVEPTKPGGGGGVLLRQVHRQPCHSFHRAEWKTKGRDWSEDGGRRDVIGQRTETKGRDWSVDGGRRDAIGQQTETEGCNWLADRDRRTRLVGGRRPKDVIG